ncbi:MAG: ABC transporter substrate-binding protein [Anaerolineaceae bacterium]
MRKLYSVLGILVAAIMVLSACSTPTAAPTEAPVVEPTEAPVVTEAPTETEVAFNGKGGWLDEIIVSVVNADSAITQLKAGAIDIYANGLSSKDFPAIQEAGLSYSTSSGLYYDILYNPAVFDDANKLNPFSNRKIREATNWLYDRDYLNQEIFAGGALPKFFAITTQFPDYADLADTARKLESYYAYDLEKARSVIATEMEGMGATLVDGKWTFKDAPVTLVFLIRNDSDGTRIPMGDYVASQLEAVGFTVDRQYKSSSEASPIWQSGDPKAGEWHMYTAAWSATVLDRDQSNIFQEMYLDSSAQGIPPFLANVSDPEFKDLGDRLAVADFTTVEERHQMMARALELSLQDSFQVFLIDGKNFIPYRTDLIATSDLAAGIEGSYIWPYTTRYRDQVGGTLKWATQGLFGEPWNPIAGSNWAYDQGVIRATSSGDVMYDPYTGLLWPLRIEKADVIVKEGLPVGKTLDWVNLEFSPEIAIADDVWADWDATAQKFLTVGEMKTKVEDAKAKAAAIEAVQPDLDTKRAELIDAFDTTNMTVETMTAVTNEYLAFASEKIGMPWDASAFIASELEGEVGWIDENLPADDAEGRKGELDWWIGYVIENTDPTAELLGLAARDYTSALRKTVVYYPADLFKTVKWHDGSNLSMADIIMGMIMTFDRAKTDSPIYDQQAVPAYLPFMAQFKGFKIISTDPLTIEYYSDAYSLDAELNIPVFFPTYTFAEGSWPMIAVSNLAEANGEVAYSADKALAKEIEQTSWVGGPTLEILAKYLDQAIAETYIPYAPTMSDYLTAEEASARYQAVKDFYAKQGHMWIGTGPYYLDKVFLTEKSAVLKRFADFPDDADRWSSFGEPKLAMVEIDGPGQVTIGQEAKFDVYVTYNDEPYAANEIKVVKYLLYNAKNEIVKVGEVVAAEDGLYSIVLDAATTGALEAGSNKLEVAVVPITVSQPTFESVEFVTAP